MTDVKDDTDTLADTKRQWQARFNLILDDTLTEIERLEHEVDQIKLSLSVATSAAAIWRGRAEDLTAQLTDMTAERDHYRQAEADLALELDQARDALSARQYGRGLP